MGESVDSEPIRHHIETTENIGMEKLMRRAEKLCAFWCVLGVLFVVGPAAGQGHWEAVVGDTAAVMNGFGDLDNQAAGAMASFGSYLYVVAGGNTGQACQLWRTANGVDWEHVLPDGFGDANNQGAVAMIEWGGYLYVGTTNLNGAQILRSDDGESWTAVVEDGNISADNRAVTDFAVFDGWLVAGTENEATGGQIWRTDNGISWPPISIGGLGDPANRAVASLEAFDGRLYAGTYKDPDFPVEPGDLQWTDDFMSWTPATVPGFGDPNNIGISAMIVYDGNLYVGTTQAPIVGTGCEVWLTDGLGWIQVSPNGFGSPLSLAVLRFAEYLGELYAGVAQPDPNVLPGGTGAKIMRFVSNPTWTPEVSDGFGDVDNWAIGSMAAFNGTFYAGTVNTSEGCEVWRNDIVFADGFESGDMGGWSGSHP